MQNRLALIKRSGLILAAAILASTASSAMPPADQPAPDFALKSHSGVNVRLSEFRGEVVVLNFWASWCRACRTEIPRLAELATATDNPDVQFIGISIDEDRVLARRSSQELGVTYPTLVDDKHVVSELYDLPTLPVTLLIDRHGVIRYMHNGYEAGNEQLYAAELNQLLAE